MISDWPSLPYHEWKDTYETLHRWLQIVGKLRLSKTAWTNHSWHSTFYVTSRGLSTSAIPLENRNLTLEFDFIDHKLTFEDSLGKYDEIWLKSESVAAFYKKFLDSLADFNVDITFDPRPNECPDCTPFYEDKIHRTYEIEPVENFYQILVNVNNIFQKFRAEYIGKSSPVHFFWGSFDLAVSRFSGRRAPEHPGIAPHISPEVIKEAYSHEVISSGFWPGNDIYPKAAFYTYIYPEPPRFHDSIPFSKAFYHGELKEFILPYDEVRKSNDPEDFVMGFLHSTYELAANLANWDRETLEESHFLHDLQIKQAGQLHLS